jgi:hypothetical protein
LIDLNHQPATTFVNFSSVYFTQSHFTSMKMILNIVDKGRKKLDKSYSSIEKLKKELWPHVAADLAMANSLLSSESQALWMSNTNWCNITATVTCTYISEFANAYTYDSGITLAMPEAWGPLTTKNTQWCWGLLV